MTKIQATIMRHLYFDGLSRNKTGRIAGGGTAMTVASETNSVVTRHNCGKDGHCKSDCDKPGRMYGKGKKPSAGHNKKTGGGAGQKWYSIHMTTTHTDAECYAQGAPRLHTTTSSTYMAGVLSVIERPIISFDDDFNKGLQL